MVNQEEIQLFYDRLIKPKLTYSDKDKIEMHSEYDPHLDRVVYAVKIQDNIAHADVCYNCGSYSTRDIRWFYEMTQNIKITRLSFNQNNTGGTLYKVYMTEYSGGMSDSNSDILVGYFIGSKAIEIAKDCSEKYPKFKDIVIGKHPNWRTLDGFNASYPYCGIVLEEIEVQK